eukprot:322946-Pleurochrysis_carterae.AAC.1
MAGGDTGHSENTRDTDDGRRTTRTGRRSAIYTGEADKRWDMGGRDRTPSSSDDPQDVTQAAALIQQSDYDTIHVLYDDVMKHYEYFDKDVREKETMEESKQLREREEQVQSGNWTERDKEGFMEENGNTTRTAKRGEEMEFTRKRTRAVGIEDTRGGQILEMHIGTMNISGISYGYRGKYMRTEEELLKIRPEDKLRE